MKARITKEFKFAVGGNHVVDVKVGQMVDGRCAEVALSEKWGVPAEELKPAVVETVAAPAVEIEAPKAEQPAENKAHAKAPKNKGR